ncbi:hypothetical protein RCL1_000581 [Eukaryota sp. TZLM3-RCL]
MLCNLFLFNVFIFFLRLSSASDQVLHSGFHHQLNLHSCGNSSNFLVYIPSSFFVDTFELNRLQKSLSFPNFYSIPSSKSVDIESLADRSLPQYLYLFNVTDSMKLPFHARYQAPCLDSFVSIKSPSIFQINGSVHSLVSNAEFIVLPCGTVNDVLLATLCFLMFLILCLVVVLL